MSLRPSPSKSPTNGWYGLEMLVGVTLSKVRSLRPNQTLSAVLPDAYQKMSSKPSPSKSPASTLSNVVLTLSAVVCSKKSTAAPHQSFSVVEPGAYQKMSASPSLSKSPTTGM